MLAVRAIYQNGNLKLLEPVDLRDGEEVEIHIISTDELLNNLLSDLVVKPDSQVDPDEIDEVELMEQLDSTTQGVTLSDIVIEERRSGI